MATEEPAKKPAEEPAKPPAAEPAKQAAAEPAKPPTVDPAKQAALSRRRWRMIRRWARRLTIVFVLLATAAMLAVAGTIKSYEADVPSTSELQNYHPPQVTRVLARNGQVIGEFFVERRTIVDIANVPKHVIYAVLAAEDASFYEHKGLDYPGMLRAMYKNVRGAKAKQGASTITQQVVKNVLLTSERTFDRKMKEVILARRIEQELTKDQILGLYLNHIYFGHGRYGIEEACQYYFGKPIEKATISEAAQLAGIVKGPSIYSPHVNKERAESRRMYVLGQMLSKGFATEQEITAAKSEPITLASRSEVLSELAPEVVEEARRTLRDAVGSEADRGGYTIWTTIDPDLQSYAREAVRNSLNGYLNRHKLVPPLAPTKKEPPAFEGAPKTSGHHVYNGVVTGHDDAKNQLLMRIGSVNGFVEIKPIKSRYNPNGLFPSQFAKVGKVLRVSLVDPKEAAVAAEDPRVREISPEAADDTPEPAPKAPPLAAMRLELAPESALVAIDVSSREVVALVGGYEGIRGGLDRSFAKRQPGSTFKAFVYGYGLHAHLLTPATQLKTSTDSINGYQPHNYDESEGKTPKLLREALAHSVNVAAVDAIQRVGPSNVAAFAKDLGIDSKLGTDLSLALGAYEVTPREMASAYATFAAKGEWRKPRLITKITGPGGFEIKLAAEPDPRQVMTEQETFVLSSLLRSVVEKGTATKAKAIGRWIAGKTGTSNNSKDTWFVGYNPDYACSVWTGFDDAAPLGKGETGAVASLPVFVEFMQRALKDKPPRSPEMPATGIETRRIDPETGLLAYEGQTNAFDEFFLADTAPDAGVDAPYDGEADAEGAPEGTDADAPANVPAPAPTGSTGDEDAGT
ncbi:MAG TPA: PBP1A family penicillin-binding protein [Polyangium sp.]|nr:PBP1A family penicillin-binding protein [Polyangium sp.]